MVGKERLIITNYFDFWDLFVNELIGNVWLAIIIGLIIVAFITLKSKMPMELTIGLCTLFLLVMYEGSQFEIILIFVVLAAGTIFFYNLPKIFERR